MGGDGMLDKHEFMKCFEDHSVVTAMSQVGIQIHEIESLFNLLDDGDGRISYDEFIEGMRHVKGSASSQDALVILRCCTQILSSCENMSGQLSGLTTWKPRQ